MSATIFIFLSAATSAALVDIGGGLIYDDVLDITWAQPDASNSFRNWDAANNWVSGLTLGGVSGWRLPYISVAAGAGPFTGTPVDCSTTSELSCRDNELGYMFYHNLGGTFDQPILDSGDPDLALFPTLQSWGYWSGTGFDSSFAWYFNFIKGSQSSIGKFSMTNSWAVHVGNVGQMTPFYDLSGSIKTAGEQDICAMVLASGEYMFSCNPIGVFSLTDLPRENNGTVKRQIYAHGFFPKIDILTRSTSEAVAMTRSGICTSYNTPYDPAVMPGAYGDLINISGKVLLQNTQTPICAMVLANGEYMFSCDGSGSYALNIQLDANGQFKLQVYADGFAAAIQVFDEFRAINDVRMTRAVECQ